MMSDELLLEAIIFIIDDVTLSALQCTEYTFCIRAKNELNNEILFM